MPDPVSSSNPAPGANPPTDSNPAPGTPNPTSNSGGNGSEFDTSKLGDEQFNKVLEDPRLWKTPRLKELLDAQKQLKTQQTEAQKAEQERLKKQGEFEKLSQQHEQDAKSWQEKYVTSVTDNAILTEAAKAGITDLDAAKKLINRGEIKIADDGTVSGVAEAITALAKEKPYLVGSKPQPNVGSGTNPNNIQPGNGGRFKMSQLNDPVFYQQHYKEISQAMASGQIEDDRA
jgi:hypothetical protein